MKEFWSTDKTNLPGEGSILDIIISESPDGTVGVTCGYMTNGRIALPGGLLSSSIKPAMDITDKVIKWHKVPNLQRTIKGTIVFVEEEDEDVDRQELYYEFCEKNAKNRYCMDNLVGKHVLSGVSYSNDENGFESMTFILDWKTVIACCDPDDGYRSYLGAFFYTDNDCPKNLPDIHINIERIEVKEGDEDDFNRKEYRGYSFMIDDSRYEKHEILFLGTDYSEDYYPCCVMNYRPGNIIMEV